MMSMTTPKTKPKPKFRIFSNWGRHDIIASMSKKEVKKDTKPAAKAKKSVTKDNQILELTTRIERLERKINSNERFARTFVRSVNAQTAATDAITGIIRKSFCEDAEMRKELHFAMDQYDKRRRRKLISNIGGIIFWVLSVAVAAFVGAFIHWVFSGQQ